MKIYQLAGKRSDYFDGILFHQMDLLGNVKCEISISTNEMLSDILWIKT